MALEFPRANLPSTAVDPDSLARHMFSRTPHPGIYIPMEGNNLGAAYISLYRSYDQFRVMPRNDNGIFNPTFVWFLGESTNDPVTGVTYVKYHPYLYKGDTKTIGTDIYPVWEDIYEFIGGGGSGSDFEQALAKHTNDQDPRYPNPHPTLARAIHQHGVEQISGLTDKITEVTNGKYASVCGSAAAMRAIATDGALAIYVGTSTSEFVVGHLYLYSRTQWVDITPGSVAPGNGKLTLKLNGVTQGEFSANQSINEEINLIVPEVVVDTELDLNSENPVQNKVIAKRLNEVLSPTRIKNEYAKECAISDTAAVINVSGRNLYPEVHDATYGTKITLGTFTRNTASSFPVVIDYDEVHSEATASSVSLGEGVSLSEPLTPGKIHYCTAHRMGGRLRLVVNDKETYAEQDEITVSDSTYSDVFIRGGKMYHAYRRPDGVRVNLVWPSDEWAFVAGFLGPTIKHWSDIIPPTNSFGHMLAYTTAGGLYEIYQITNPETMEPESYAKIDLHNTVRWKKISSGLPSFGSTFGIDENDDLYVITSTRSTKIAGGVKFKDVSGFTLRSEPDLYAIAISTDNQLYFVDNDGTLTRSTLTNVTQAIGPVYKNKITGLAVGGADQKLYELLEGTSTGYIEVPWDGADDPVTTISCPIVNNPSTSTGFPENTVPLVGNGSLLGYYHNGRIETILTLTRAPIPATKVVGGVGGWMGLALSVDGYVRLIRMVDGDVFDVSNPPQLDIIDISDKSDWKDIHGISLNYDGNKKHTVRYCGCFYGERSGATSESPNNLYAVDDYFVYGMHYLDM